MPQYEDDDVKVLYDVPYANGNVNGGGATQHRASRNSRNSSTVNCGIIGNRVDFEIVFDPDEVQELFNDAEEKIDENDDSWEKPTVFNDPRKVRKQTGVSQNSSKGINFKLIQLHDLVLLVAYSHNLSNSKKRRVS